MVVRGIACVFWCFRYGTGFGICVSFLVMRLESSLMDGGVCLALRFRGHFGSSGGFLVIRFMRELWG